MKQKRLAWLDILRLACVAAVVLGHIATWDLALAPAGSAAWTTACLYNAAVRAHVPLLLMISGYLALEQPDIAACFALQKRRVPRFAAAWLFWSACYALPDLFDGLRGGTPPQALAAFARKLARGEFHLWYLVVCVILYLLLPLLYLATRQRMPFAWLLGISFAAGLALPALAAVPGLAWMEAPCTALHLDAGYLFYFAAGYWFRRWPPRAAARRWLYLGGGIGAVWTVGGTLWASLRQGQLCGQWLAFGAPGVALMALAVFAVVQAHGQNWHTGRLAGTLARSTLGIYAVHVFALLALRKFGITMFDFAPLWWMPAAALGVLAASALAARVLHRLPGLRYFV